MSTRRLDKLKLSKRAIICISTYTFLIFSFVVTSLNAKELISVSDLLKDGFVISAVSESIADEGQGANTNLFLQKADVVYVCGMVGRLAFGKAVQLFSCNKLQINSSFMREMPQQKGAN